MLVVKIELWPFGKEENKKEIGRTYIWNDGSGNSEQGNYGVEVCRDGIQKLHKNLIDSPSTTVENHERHLNVWRLVQKALNNWFGD